MKEQEQRNGHSHYALLADSVDVLPFYDKYQFRDGVTICDIILSGVLEQLMDNAGYYLSHIGFDHKKDPAKLIVLSHRLNLPMSMPLAIKYAGLSLRWLHSCDEELLTTFLPLVENENAVLRSMVSTLMGRKCKGMTPEDIHNVTKEKDFAKKCV